MFFSSETQVLTQLKYKTLNCKFLFFKGTIIREKNLAEFLCSPIVYTEDVENALS